ncbi:MAG: hypothetical protein Edafosvirus5_69, partial [Edafosvirus sp.]
IEFCKKKLLENESEKVASYLNYILGNLYNGMQLTNNNNCEIPYNFFKLSSDAGNSYGQYSLGRMYDYGLFVPADHTEAEKLMRLSLSQNNFLAQYYLGSAFPNNYDFLSLSAKQGYGEAKKKIKEMICGGMFPTEYNEIKMGGMTEFIIDDLIEKSFS